MEILFGCIHGCIYILIYDDHNPSFTEDQKLQMGWVIIFACGIILVISLRLNLIEQVRAVLAGLRLLKQLMSKKEKGSKRKRVGDRIKLEYLAQNDQSTLFDTKNKTDFDLETLNGTESFAKRIIIVEPAQVSRSRSMAFNKKIRRAKLAQRIRDLRQINGVNLK